MYCRWGLDSGLVVVIFITTVYLLLVFGLFFYVKNEWCYVLFKNYTVRKRERERRKKVRRDGNDEMFMMEIKQ